LRLPEAEESSQVLQRLPLPPQLDRVIMVGGAAATFVAAPLVIVLVALLIADRLTGPEVVFWLLAALIVGGALGSVLLPNIVHAALMLVVALLGVAGIYLLLGSEFLALAQVLLYGGGVAILIVFGLMLTNAQDDPIVTDGAQKPFALGIAVILGGIITAAMVDASWADVSVTVIPFTAFGERLFADFGTPFILIAILLDVALSGAYIIARRDPADEEAGQ
jgi:NADH:ubiquinone oxidoreductase subunit 6 (subunit J)